MCSSTCHVRHKKLPWDMGEVNGGWGFRLAVDECATFDWRGWGLVRVYRFGDEQS